MTRTPTLMRLLAVVAALTLVTAACGDDGDAATGTPADDTAADDGAGDDGAGDDGAGDDGSADDGAGDDGAGDDGAGDDGSADDGSADDGATFGNCDDFADALDGLNDIADAGDPTSGDSPEALRQDFEQAQASIAALKSALPADLQADAQTIADGIAALEEGFASIGYDVTNLSSPEDALAFAGLMSGAEVLAMAGASINIQQWVAAGCS